MATGLLSDISSKGAHAEPAAEAAVKNDIPVEAPAQPAYLTRLAMLPATLPERLEACSHADSQGLIHRPEAARLDQIEQALTILASVVARLAKEAQQTRIQLRSTEHDPGLQEERRVQRELVRSMQARLDHIEERFDRERGARLEPVPAGGASLEVAGQVAESLRSIRESLAALAKRKPRPNDHGSRS
jgi:hypothetical protein